jgi:hypothetical protein
VVAQTSGGYRRIEYKDDVFVLLRTDNTVEIYTSLESEPVSVTEIETSVLDAAVVSRTKILMIDSGGELMETVDFGKTWTTSGSQPPERCTLIRTVNNGEILCAADIQSTFVSRLVTEIELDSELQSGVFQAGDTCFLSVAYPEVPPSLNDARYVGESTSPWESYGPGEIQRIQGEGAPSGGNGIIRISAGPSGTPPERYAAISQKITGAQTGAELTAGEFYIFSIWARQDAISAGTVKVWISGAYDSLGIEFTDIGTDWNKYTYKFSVPRNIASGPTDNIRINIAATGEGTYYFDKAYLGLVSEQENIVPSDYRSLLRETAPTILRSDYLSIGTWHLAQNAWASNGELETAMKLVLESGEQAAPWDRCGFLRIGIRAPKPDRISRRTYFHHLRQNATRQRILLAMEQSLLETVD